MNADGDFLQRLARSNLFTEFKEAFCTSIGLPLALRRRDFWQLAHRGQLHENPLCALLAKSNRACAAYLQVEQSAVDAARNRAATVRCSAGLCHTAVPVKLGTSTIGFLMSGQVALEPRTAAGFETLSRLLSEWGLEAQMKQLEAAYYRSTVLPPAVYAGQIGLLEIFSRQLSSVGNQMLQQDALSEQPMVRRAKAYIAGHHGDPIGLEEIARAMHVSVFYFCKIFKKSTGLTFTNYLARVRLEKAKSLLLNPRLRISDIAYTVGFQSLTHFNRLFRRLTGESPTSFRYKSAVQGREAPKKLPTLRTTRGAVRGKADYLAASSQKPSTMRIGESIAG
jgi:AraC-like DNA-binding protein